MPNFPPQGKLRYKSMRKYEGLFIFPPEEGPEAAKQEDAQLEEMITRFGGRVVERHDWGRRPLGYLLRKFREGRFLLWNFELEGAQLVELRRTLQLNEKILKSTLLKFEAPKPPKEKSKTPRNPKPPAREGSHARQP